MIITSPTNPKIKETAALQQKKERDRTGLILVESKHPVEEALKAGLSLQQLFVLEGHPLHFETAIEPIEVSDTAMARMATTDSPPVCIAVFERPRWQVADLFQAPSPLLLILDQIQDPGNVGTLIRSAAAFGGTGIALTAGSADPYNPKVIRSSAGLVFSQPVVSLNQPLEAFLPDLAEEKITVYLTSSHTTTPYRQADFRSPCALCLGNEGTGLSEEVLTGNFAGGIPLTIPMAAGVESLNVSITGALLLAEAAHQRDLSL